MAKGRVDTSGLRESTSRVPNVAQESSYRSRDSLIMAAGGEGSQQTSSEAPKDDECRIKIICLGDSAVGKSK